jgi:hypothetical protein
MWEEQEDSRNRTRSSNGKIEYTLVFETELGQGEVEAEDQGFIIGDVVTYDGHTLVLDRIKVTPRGGAFDRVELIYISPDYQSSGGGGHSDGKLHKAGDNEFSLETADEQMSASDALRYGYLETLAEVPEESTLTIAVAYVVWRRWLSPKGVIKLDGRGSSYPNEFSQVQTMLNSYIHNTGDWDDNLSLNDKVSWNTKLQVEGITVSEDGNLLLREARLKYHPFWT